MSYDDVVAIVSSSGNCIPVDGHELKRDIFTGHFESRDNQGKSKTFHTKGLKVFDGCCFGFDPSGRLQTLSQEKAKEIFEGLGIPYEEYSHRIGYFTRDGKFRMPFIQGLAFACEDEEADIRERGITDEFITACKAIVNESLAKEAREKAARKAKEAEDKLFEKMERLEINRREGLMKKKAGAAPPHAAHAAPAAHVSAPEAADLALVSAPAAAPEAVAPADTDADVTPMELCI